MISGILIMTGLAGIFGMILAYFSTKYKIDSDPVTDQIEALLPQTQCGQCGYIGCRPYAEAIAQADAPINQCPPGGQTTIKALADLLALETLELNPDNGEVKSPEIALIDESTCIGCTLCIQACPVDAILGAAKLMHTVISSQCTGCELCLPPCPVDCIEMITTKTTADTWHPLLPLSVQYSLAPNSANGS